VTVEFLVKPTCATRRGRQEPLQVAYVASAAAAGNGTAARHPATASMPFCESALPGSHRSFITREAHPPRRMSKKSSVFRNRRTCRNRLGTCTQAEAVPQVQLEPEHDGIQPPAGGERDVQGLGFRVLGRRRHREMPCLLRRRQRPEHAVRQRCACAWPRQNLSETVVSSDRQQQPAELPSGESCSSICCGHTCGFANTQNQWPRAQLQRGQHTLILSLCLSCLAIIVLHMLQIAPDR